MGSWWEEMGGGDDWAEMVGLEEMVGDRTSASWSSTLNSKVRLTRSGERS